MSNTPTSGTSHPASCIQRLTSRISHLATYTIIQLLTTAIKFRKAGLISLLAFFLINCYFMLFNQNSYILFLEHFSPDGNISNLSSTFFRIQLLISFSIPLWLYITSKSLQETISPHTHQHWYQSKRIYIFACISWLFISYSPFLLLNNETIRHLAAEDSFYENAGFLWLLLTASAFFYLYFKKTSLAQQKKHNIFFLLLGILFFFAAGEEISWGQRVFHIATPQILNSNIQHELNIHNLPIFKWGTTDRGFLDWILDVNTQFINFFFIYAYFTPLLYESIKSIRSFLNKTSLPIPPAWLSIFFLINYYLSQFIAQKVNNAMIWPITEIKETAFCFLFFVISLWMITTAHIKKKPTHNIDGVKHH